MSKKIKLEERVTVYGTGTSYMQKNVAYQVHPLNADYLISVGRASATKLK